MKDGDAYIPFIMLALCVAVAVGCAQHSHPADDLPTGGAIERAAVHVKNADRLIVDVQKKSTGTNAERLLDAHYSAADCISELFNASQSFIAGNVKWQKAWDIEHGAREKAENSIGYWLEKKVIACSIGLGVAFALFVVVKIFAIGGPLGLVAKFIGLFMPGAVHGGVDVLANRWAAK